MESHGGRGKKRLHVLILLHQVKLSMQIVNVLEEFELR